LAVDDDSDWTPALIGAGCVVHCAARVHVMRDDAADPLAEFRRVNVAGSLRLARQAAKCGVRRFVFVSSIKVNGEATHPNRPFRADDVPRPLDTYGRSKAEAEDALRDFARAAGIELVIVRPPLIHGPGVRANFHRMMVWLHRGIPLPFGAIDNRRSLLGLDNLCDLLAVITRHPAAAGQTLLAADGEDVSTAELMRRLGTALNRPARLIGVQERTLSTLLGLVGQDAAVHRLFGWLQVDIGPTCTCLGWQPPASLDDGLRQAAASYLEETRRR
jgi:nucleoside-diphosphate-sugar epimerase